MKGQNLTRFSHINAGPYAAAITAGAMSCPDL